MDCASLFNNTLYSCAHIIVAVVAAVPVLSYFLYQFLVRAAGLIWDRLTVTVQFSGDQNKRDETDYLYHWMLRWLANNIDVQQVAATHYIEGKVDYSSRLDRQMTFMTPPGLGTHYFTYKKCCYIRLVRSSGGDEFLTMTCFRWNKSLLFEIVEECQRTQPRQAGKTVIYQNGSYRDGWRQTGKPKIPRDLETVILGPGIKEKVVEDINLFLTREAWYVNRGIPYRRGYLFYGPPGNGKTSLVTAIAGAIGYDLCVLSLAAEALCDDTLTDLMNNTPSEKCIVLLEDVDAAFKRRSDKTATKRETTLAFGGESSSRVTFAGLLNALDGVTSRDGRILIMTTNFVDRLDPALIRQGRVDQRILVDNPNITQIFKIIDQLYVDRKMEEDTKIKFVEKIRQLETSEGVEVSMAMIQSFLIEHMDEEKQESMLDKIEEYIKEQCSSNWEEPEDDKKCEKDDSDDKKETTHECQLCCNCCKCKSSLGDYAKLTKQEIDKNIGETKENGLPEKEYHPE